MRSTSVDTRTVIAFTLSLGAANAGCQSLSGLSGLEDAAGGASSTGAAGATGGNGGSGAASGGTGAVGGTGSGGDGAGGGTGGDPNCQLMKPAPMCNSVDCTGMCGGDDYCELACPGAAPFCLTGPVMDPEHLPCLAPMADPMACRFLCNIPDGCDGRDIRCPPGETCEVRCQDEESCTGTTVTCADGPCILRCDAPGACDSVTLDCGPGACSVECSGASPGLDLNQGPSCNVTIEAECGT